MANRDSDDMRIIDGQWVRFAHGRYERYCNKKGLISRHGWYPLVDGMRTVCPKCAKQESQQLIKRTAALNKSVHTVAKQMQKEADRMHKETVRDQLTHAVTCPRCGKKTLCYDPETELYGCLNTRCRARMTASEYNRSIWSPRRGRSR